MNYLKVYFDLCDSRMNLKKERFISKSTEEYFEFHHIIMKSLGGSDDESNLVLLTDKEHIIAHHLLYKNSLKDINISKNERIKYGFAFNSMAGVSSSDNHRNGISIRIIVEARKVGRESFKEYWNDPINKEKHSNTQRKRFENPDERIKISKTLKQSCNDEIFKIKISDRFKKLWEDKTYKESMGQKFKDSHKKRRKEKLCKIRKEVGNRPELKDAAKKRAIKQFESKDSRNHLSEVIKNKWKDPNYKRKMAIANSKTFFQLLTPNNVIVITGVKSDIQKYVGFYIHGKTIKRESFFGYKVININKTDQLVKLILEGPIYGHR